MKDKPAIRFIWPLLVMLAFYSCSEKKTNQHLVQKEVVDTVTQEEKKRILFFGNSLTAGYGIDEEDAFPALIQSKIDSLGIDYQVINGGLSGETTASGLNRLDWFLEDRPHIFVLELGANDGLRGIAISETRNNLNAIIEKVKTKYPDTIIILAGMQIPPNMGEDYTTSFKSMYKQIADQHGLVLVPFLLEGVAGDPLLNLPDGIHPTEEGHRIVAETVWQHLYSLL